ncbi:MAG: SWIM zinc finger family protein [Solirubrobacterales bacterium]
MASFDHHHFYERSVPLPAEGGIEARSRRGAIGETWWSQRFIELLESFGVGSRLKRGRNYARAGQVVELDIEHGVVLAKVQGSRYSPYRVRIRYKALTENQWRRAEKAMAAQALPLAKLLAGEMPHDVEELFESCKLALFPRCASELTATCTCPDGVNPCKHIAATYYILAERFDEDPFLIFTWRGRDQDELVESLRKRRAPAGRGAKTSTTSAEVADVPEPSAPLSAVLDSFWSCGPELEAFHVSPLAGEAPDALLRQLGAAPVEVGEHNLAEVLAGAYVTLAHAAEQRALSE